MLHPFNAAAVIACTCSLAAATPVLADVSVLKNVTKGSSSPSTLSAIHDLNRRDNATVSNDNAATDITILAPISKASFTAATFGALNMLRKRDEADSPIIPQNNVTLYFASSDTATSNIVAELNATMKHPSVLLEDISAVTDVKCSTSSVKITFSDATTFASSLDLWSSETFLLFTNHLGNCDTDTERGIYMVNRVQSDNTKLMITAESVEISFSNSTETMDISFLTPTTTTAAKRGLLSNFIGSFPTNIIVADNSVTVSTTTGPTEESLQITDENTSFTGSLDLAGHGSFDFRKFNFTDFYFDLDLSASTAAKIEVEVTGSCGDNLFTYSPLDLRIAAFSIAGILNVGPQIAFELGVEVSAKGSVGISTDFTVTLADGLVHLDLLNSTGSYTSGWTPTFTHKTNITAAVETQVNPYVQLTAEIGANLLNVIDLGTGISLKPEILNVFDVNGDFQISNTNNTTFTPSTETNLPTGCGLRAALSSILLPLSFSVYSVTLYEYTALIYESRCWS
ncbi:hypothetical protein BKA64DRAFT_715388 [Cadophora sp. MPI-SDFR-AT-0126]|nr:hypothetical protein BKA64DRAFT_715388 [Leotiomycetes sp. MPI-SDFR-AT-0126]